SPLISIHTIHRQNLNEDLTRRKSHAKPEVIDGDVAREREQPRLERPRWIVRVSRAVHGHQRVLEDVLEFVRVRDPTAQEAQERGGHVRQELIICLTVPALHTFHPPRALHASGPEGLFVHFVSRRRRLPGLSGLAPLWRGGCCLPHANAIGAPEAL